VCAVCRASRTGRRSWRTSAAASCITTCRRSGSETERSCCVRCVQSQPDWQEILTHFRGSELQNYFQKILEDDLKAIIKPQYVDNIPKAVRCAEPFPYSPFFQKELLKPDLGCVRIAFHAFCEGGMRSAVQVGRGNKVGRGEILDRKG
jgi:hypothetical protein